MVEEFITRENLRKKVLLLGNLGILLFLAESTHFKEEQRPSFLKIKRRKENSLKENISKKEPSEKTKNQEELLEQKELSLKSD